MRAQRASSALIEMQPRRRRGDRPRCSREHGLIARLVGLVRQRAQCTAATEPRRTHRRTSSTLRSKFEAIQITATLDHRRRFIERLEQHDASRLQRFADADLTQRAPIALDAFDQQLGRAARVLASMQTRANHARVVQHEQIVRRQQVGQIREPLMRDRIAISDRAPSIDCRCGCAAASARSDAQAARSEVAARKGHWLDRPTKERGEST